MEQVRQCLGFCTADFLSWLVYESALQKTQTLPNLFLFAHLGWLCREGTLAALFLIFIALDLLDEDLEVVVHVEVGEAVEEAVVGDEEDLSQLPNARRATWEPPVSQFNGINFWVKIYQNDLRIMRTGPRFNTLLKILLKIVIKTSCQKVTIKNSRNSSLYISQEFERIFERIFTSVLNRGPGLKARLKGLEYQEFKGHNLPRIPKCSRISD